MSGEQWASIGEVGANLRGFRAGDLDVTHVNSRAAIPPKSSGAVLIPWPNRIAAGKYRFGDVDQQLALSDPLLGNASHGLACWIRWSPVETADDHVTLACDVVPQKGWPYELHAEITYGVSASGLTVTLSATNVGVEALPFGAGFHPYLSIGDCALADVEITLDASRAYVVDERQIPTGAVDVEGTELDLRGGRRLGDLRLDTAFTGLASSAGRGTATVRTPDRVSTLWWDASAFDTVQVFTPPALVDRPAVAIEPMTCPANAFNSGVGLQVLAPGETWSGRWGIEPPVRID